MLKRLKFAHKVALMPGLSALAFLVILAVSWGVGGKNSDILRKIENGSFPAVDASREQEAASRRHALKALGLE